MDASKIAANGQASSLPRRHPAVRGRATVVVATLAAAGVFAAGAQGTATAAEQVPAGTVAVMHPPEAGTAGGGVRTMSEGGRDGDHWWIKISTAEIASIGAAAACRSKLPPPVAGIACPPLAAAINDAVGKFPGAGGFWAELYDSGQVRAGKW
ncbi:MAG: hypothetical protein ACRDUV_07465 [Pseudonocardiaceae bacterium]